MSTKLRFILKRTALSIVSVFIIITILFFLFRLLPGDPSTALAPLDLPRDVRQQIVEQYGLDRPVHVQYIQYLKQLATLNFGTSYAKNTAVSGIILDRVINTIVLFFTSLVIAFSVGPLIGAYTAWNRGETVDTVSIGAIMAIRGMPHFWLGMLAIMLFSFELGWFPPGGMLPPTYEPNSILERFFTFKFLEHLLLPLSVVTLVYLVTPTFITRNSMIDILGEQYIELCRAQGFTQKRIIYKHALRNAILPVLHYAAVLSAYAIGGSVVLETVFAWPGLGRTLWTAVQHHDYPLAQGSFIMIAILVIVFNWAADIISVFIDPRVGEQE